MLGGDNGKRHRKDATTNWSLFQRCYLTCISIDSFPGSDFEGTGVRKEAGMERRPQIAAKNLRKSRNRVR